jgi:hypothetical protein
MITSEFNVSLLPRLAYVEHQGKFLSQTVFLFLQEDEEDLNAIRPNQMA